jgi:hypothetical protein
MATARLAATSGDIVLYTTQPRKPIQRLAFCDVLALVLFSLVFFNVNLYVFSTICEFALFPSQNKIWDCQWRDIILFLSHHTSVLAIPLRTGFTQRTLSDSRPKQNKHPALTPPSASSARLLLAGNFYYHSIYRVTAKESKHISGDLKFSTKKQSVLSVTPQASLFTQDDYSYDTSSCWHSC